MTGLAAGPRQSLRLLLGALFSAAALSFLCPTPGTAAPRLGKDAAEEPEPNDAIAAPRRVVLRFLTEVEFPPFDFYDEEGVLTGFNVDLARAICFEIGAACDLKVRPWEELIPALLRGEADAVIAAHVVDNRLLGQVEFSDRYFFTPGRFAARRDQEQAPITREDLDGKRIAVLRGTPHEAFIKAFFPDSVIQPFESSDLARESLAQGKTDYIFDDAISLAFWLNGTSSRQCCEFRGDSFLEPRYFGDGVAIAVPKNDPEIRKLINDSLHRLRENGRMEELVQRYFPFRIY